MAIPVTVLEAFDLAAGTTYTEPLNQGLINRTWKIGSGRGDFILQRVNTEVFAEPQVIAENIALIDHYLKERHPGYLFVSPLTDGNGRQLVRHETGCYRAFPFIDNSHTKTVATNANEAYEAARQFGRFTAALKDFDTKRLQTTIPGFHDLGLRYRQFTDAVANGIAGRKAVAAELTAKLQSWSHLSDQYEHIRLNSGFKLRVTHHDTKISNVLFNKDNQGICVIDLDTVMPGYFISDVGDMMRTYLSPASEEEQNLELVKARADFYEAIVSGYLHEMKDELTGIEKDYFFYAGQFMIYMQALRFLSDYLTGDKYYPIHYPDQNLRRAENQVRLLEELEMLGKQG